MTLSILVTIAMRKAGADVLADEPLVTNEDQAWNLVERIYRAMERERPTTPAVATIEVITPSQGWPKRRAQL